MGRLIIDNVDLDKLEVQRQKFSRFVHGLDGKYDFLEGIANMLDAWSDENTCWECSSVLTEGDLDRGVCRVCGESLGEDYFDEEEE